MSTPSVSSSLTEPPGSQNTDPGTENQNESAAVNTPTPKAPSEAERMCDPFVDKFAGMMNHENISAVLEEQARMLSIFEVANEKLDSLNKISELSYFNMSVELRQTTKTLVSMKKELDSIFRRIRSLKSQVASQYPEAYSEAIKHQSQQADNGED